MLGSIPKCKDTGLTVNLFQEGPARKREGVVCDSGAYATRLYHYSSYPALDHVDKPADMTYLILMELQ